MGKINLSAFINLLLPLLSLAVIIAVGVGLIYPWAKDGLEKKEEIASRKKELNEVLLPKLNVLQGLNKEILREQLTQIEFVLPSYSQAPYIFSNIENLAAENEVLVEGLSYVVSEKKNLPEAIEFNFTASGDFSFLVNFAVALEETAPLFALESYAQAKTEEGTEKTSLAVSSFYKTLPEKIGGVRETLEKWDKSQQEALGKLEKFKVRLVAFGDEETPSVPLGKVNPF